MPKKAPTPEQAQRAEWRKELRSIRQQIKTSEAGVARLAKTALREEAAAQKAIDALRTKHAKGIRQAQAAHDRLAGKLAKRSGVLEGRLSS